jgi:hypothetical protein
MLRVLVWTVLLAAAPMGIGAVDEILWSAERPLAWEDFQGRVKDGGNDLRVATAATSIGWSYAYRTEWSNSECSFRVTDIESSAKFATSDSWVKAGHRTPDVLAHEQGHFDIAEIYRRKFDAEAQASLAAGSCRGQRRNRVSRFVEREIEGLVGAVFERVWTEYRESQDRYDLETEHGLDARSQAEWAASIASALSGRPPTP